MPSCVNDRGERAIFVLKILVIVGAFSAGKSSAQSMFVLDAQDFKHHVDFFNGMEPENIVDHISNAQSWAWMEKNVPFFECPDKDFERIYYFRWWTFRKHIKHTPDGFVFTEFLDQVGHSGKHNTISCALGHHIYEGTWLRDQRYIDDYARSHQFQGRPYIGEYHDEKNGQWLRPDSDRSRYYNHSTFCDLVISRFVGLVPQEDHTVVVDPLLPEASWDWLCLDNVPYRGRCLTIVWGADGQTYGKGRGLRVFVDGIEIAVSKKLGSVKGELP